VRGWSSTILPGRAKKVPKQGFTRYDAVADIFAHTDIVARLVESASLRWFCA
jgi:hypothetical protein